QFRSLGLIFLCGSLVVISFVLAPGLMYIAPARMIPVAIVVGLALELLKVKLQKEYGPFYISVTIILWSFAPRWSSWLTRIGPPAGSRGLNDEELESDGRGRRARHPRYGSHYSGA